MRNHDFLLHFHSYFANLNPTTHEVKVMEQCIPVLVNRIFAGLFLLFHVPGSRAPEGRYGETDNVSRETLESISKLGIDPEELEIALSKQIEALKNLPLPDPGPSIEECCKLARVNGCDVIDGEKWALISRPLVDFALCLEIKRNEVTIKLYEPKTQSNYLEVCYWQPDHWVLVCKPYLHPLASNYPVIKSLLIGLMDIDREYGCDAILNQTLSWTAKD